MITTLTAWKARLQVGTQIRQIWHFSKGATDDVVFTITQLQTNGVWGIKLGEEQRRWLEFPKRTEIVFTENGWIRVESTGKIAEYVWVD